MLVRGKFARKYWKAFLYILLIFVIVFYISKNNQNLVKNRQVGIKRMDAFESNYRRHTINDVKPETERAHMFNLTYNKTTVMKNKIYKVTIRPSTKGSQSKELLSDERIVDYFRDKNYSKPLLQPEVRHIAFLKVHKAASSTMQNMFFRFGRKRNLNFVFTKHPNYFSRSAETHIPLVPPKSTKGYDILCNHGIFNFTTYSSLLPNDTVYIGIVRDPLSVFVSAVNFYSQESQKLGYLTKIQGQKLQKLIHRPEVYDRSFFSYTKNVMSRDFGFPETFNSSIVFNTLQELDKIFTLVLIVEHFEESLVLMKRYLNWKLQDILFLPNNVYIKHDRMAQRSRQLHRNTTFDHRVMPWYGGFRSMRSMNRDKPASKSDLSPNDLHQFKIRNMLDYYVYSFFTHKFWKQFKSASGNIEQEVAYFKQVLEKLKLFCNHTKINDDRDPLVVQKSKWNEQFTITVEDCVFMKMDELKFIKLLRYKQGSVLQESKDNWFARRHGRRSLDELHKQQLRRNQVLMKLGKLNNNDNLEIAEREFNLRRHGINPRIYGPKPS